MFILYIVIGVLIGGGIVWFVNKDKVDPAKIEEEKTIALEQAEQNFESRQQKTIEGIQKTNHRKIEDLEQSNAEKKARISELQYKIEKLELQKLRIEIDKIPNQSVASEQQLLMLGRLMSETVKSKKSIASLREVEFKVFSQWGDDGIIQWLVNNLEFPNKTFVEFGVENYRESNTRFLMMNDNWSGLVMDGSESKVAQIINSEYFWKYTLSAKAVFIDTENINNLISSSGLGKEIGILHIDIDGNDYWIWKAINVISPIVVILEYNSVFGIDRAITIPYEQEFHRTNAHYSNLYFGASLRALHQLSTDKGYSLIGCNSTGNNAYFVRKDKLNNVVRELSLEDGYVISKFRESRDKKGRLLFNRESTHSSN